MPSARKFLCAVAALASLATIASPAPSAHAQQYPNRSITLIVGFAAGGVADGIGRLVGQKLSARLGQNVVVENRGGAGGNIAARAVAGAAADGYTILVTTTAMAINETMHKSRGFAASDFRTAAIVASTPEAFAVAKANAANSLKELVANAKGKTVNFGTAGVGSGSHIAAEYFFKELAKVPATHVPFQGGAPAINAAVAGHIDMISASLGGGLVAQVNAGNLKGLGVASDKRVGAIAGVPTLAEAGYPNFQAASWVGFFVPAKTDPQVVAKLNEAIDAIMKEPDVLERLSKLGFDPVNGSQAQAEAMFKAEVGKWGKMVTSLGLTVN